MRIWGAVFGPADMQCRRPKVEEIQVSSPAFKICAVLHRSPSHPRDWGNTRTERESG
jgi:hypothetical protein